MMLRRRACLKPEQWGCPFLRGAQAPSQGRRLAKAAWTLEPCLRSHESLKPGMCPSSGSGNLASSSMEPPSPSAALSSGESCGDWRRRRRPSSLPEGGICDAWPAPAAVLLGRDPRTAGPRSCAPPESSTLCVEPLATLPPATVAGSLRKRKPSSPRRAGKTAEETWLGSGLGSVGLGLGARVGLGLGQGWTAEERPRGRRSASPLGRR